MVNIKQIGKNIEDIAKGSYHGSAYAVQCVPHCIKDTFIEVSSFGTKHADLQHKDLTDRANKIPKNKYGLIPAVVSGLCTLTLGSLLFSYGLTRGLNALEESLNEKPKIEYIVHGKTVKTIKFNTNEELNKYSSSIQGKAELEYYQFLNSEKE